MTQLLPDIRTLIRRPEASTIEAVQFDGTNDHAAQILRWANTAIIFARLDNPTDPDGNWILLLREGETDMPVRAGDWVAKGALGQFYTLPDEILRATYDTDAETADEAITAPADFVPLRERYGITKVEGGKDE